MLGVLLLLAQTAAAAPPAAATPAPSSGAPRSAPLLGRSTDAAQPAPRVSAEPRSLADLARERRASGVKPHGGTLSVTGGSGASASGSTAAGPGDRDSDPSRSAQERMDRAMRDGASADHRRSESARADARAEWDAAAESCRQTPGCKPGYRDDTRIEGHKPVQTNEEAIREVARKHHLSE
jgi:hypothetical protein